MNPFSRILVAMVLVMVFCTLAQAQSAKRATSPVDTTEAAKLLGDIFAEESPARRADLAARFGKVAPASLDELKRLLRQSVPFGRVEFGPQNFETRPSGSVPAIKYLVNVPDAYKPDAPEGWPLIMGCPGTGGTPEQQLVSLVGIFGTDILKYIVVCAQSPEEGPYKFDELAVEYPVVVVNDVRRRLNINSDRIVITGYSKGGYTAWGEALFRPGLWAGALPLACFPLTDAGRHGCRIYMANGLPLAVQHHWGDQDILQGQKEGIFTFARMAAEEMKRLGARKFEPVEYAGQGHGLKLNTEKMRKFVADARRDRAPAEFSFLFHHMWEGGAYYVRAVEPAKPELDLKHLPTVQVTDAADVGAAVLAMMRREAFEITARLRKDDNAVAIKTRNLKAIEVDLVAEAVDLARVVKVVVNDRVAFNKKLAIDYAVLLEAVRDTGDFDRLVLARIAVTVPVK